MLYIPVVFVTIWTVIPAFETVMAWQTSAIVDNVCLPWGFLDDKMMSAFLIVQYFLPMAVMIFCYSRVVRALMTKVTRHHHLSEF